MYNSTGWDWEIGKRLITDTNEWKTSFEWIEEPNVSPDGEKIAAIIRDEEMTFSVCVNGTAWESAFDKIWNLRFGPDSRLTALVSDTGEWTVAVDGAAWENRFDYVWNTQFSPDGSNIIAAVQKGGEYFIASNDGSADHSRGTPPRKPAS